MDKSATRSSGVWVSESAPSACTLPTVDRPLRLAEFDGLFATGVRSVERPDRHSLRLELAPDPAVAARAADLVVREGECCSFFTFTLTVTGGRVWLGVAVPGRQVEVLDAIAARAAERAGA